MYIFLQINRNNFIEYTCGYIGQTFYSSEDWIDLEQVGKKWRAIVSTVMKVIFQKYKKFLDKLRKYVLRISFLSLR